MTIEAADPAERPRSSSTPTAGDVVLAVVVVAVAVAMQVTGLDSIPANRDPDALGVLLTVAAVAPLAWRRVRPLAVLVACLPGPLLLIAFHYSVGVTTLGVVIAFSTCIAWGSTREARAAVAVLAVRIGLAAVLGPIDLRIEGALSHVTLLIGGWVIGWGVRERRELLALRETEAQHEAEAGWRRSGRSAARWTTWHFPSWSARFATR